MQLYEGRFSQTNGIDYQLDIVDNLTTNTKGY